MPYVDTTGIPRAKLQQGRGQKPAVHKLSGDALDFVVPCLSVWTGEKMRDVGVVGKCQLGQGQLWFAGSTECGKQANERCSSADDKVGW